MEQEEANKKILKLMNKNYLSKKENKLFKELIYQCDLTKKNNNMGYIILRFALRYNQDQNLNLNKDQWDYLIKNSNLKIQDNIGLTPLMWALRYNKEQNLNLNQEQFEYLIKNSDLKIQDENGWNSLMSALYYNEEQNLNLTKKQFQEMYHALNEEQKQITFQKFIQTKIHNNNNDSEDLNILLYDLKFNPNEKTIKYLKENKYQDIIQMIEKRDVFFQLNQDFKKIDKKEKIDKMKI